MIIALIAAFAMTLAAGTEAFANEPGESNSWAGETQNRSPIQSRDTMAEANGYSGLVQIWRGWDNNIVWLSVNHLRAFSFSNADGSAPLTGVAPRVINSNGWYYAFYTSTSGRIYWSRAQDNGTAPSTGIAWSNWQVLAGQTTHQSVSLASVPYVGMMMVYRGASDQRMWSSWLPINSVNWNNARQLEAQEDYDGLSYQSIWAPTVTYNEVNNYLYVAYAEPNGEVQLLRQPIGHSDWFYADSLDGDADASPVVAATSTGNMLVAARAADNSIWMNRLERNGIAFHSTGWQQESQHWHSLVAPFLSVAGAVAIMLLTGENDGAVWWKQAYNGS
ncbi:hypothetical protein [Actinacidiphila sp. bgisy167]|uniref:hypothetical protein n=1 Tax=Actinacidiphila sp. bgisy167 TaxID=3413797 RepID=UPI003D71A6E1